jgi:hypothetical protein
VDKTRLLVICGIILSVFALIALAADMAEENEPATDEAVMQFGDVNETQPEMPDPNSHEAKLNKAWADAERANNSEARGWLKLEMAQRIDVARAAKRTTDAQLDLLKMIAESEGAAQTVAAIDKLLEDRAAKVDEALDQAREERRLERIKELEERRKAREEMRQNRRERTTQQREDF